MTTYAAESDVVVIGSGPVGMSLACDLADNGVSVVVVERRAYGEPPSVKCNHVSARTMEIFRRFGIAGSVRSAGLPEDHAHDVAFRTTFTGIELNRVRIPSRRDRFTATDADDGGWPTPEPPHRINQIYLEPILADHMVSLDGVRLLNDTEYVRHQQGEDGVRVQLQRAGGVQDLRCNFLVGCDGGASSVRKAIGATLEGTAVIQRVQSTLIRAPDLMGLLQDSPSWGCYVVNPRRCGTVFAIDGRELFLIHNYLLPPEADFDSVSRDWAIRTILGVDDAFRYEVVSEEDWFGRRLVADRFRDRRVFIAGDAAHLWVPYAGYGMNAGIADALNLSWLLGAVMNGWADDSILNAYQAERRPITDQVSRFAMDHAAKMTRARAEVPADIEEASETGEAIRARVGQEYRDTNVGQFCAAGLNFGYFYDASPIIDYGDREQPPDYTMGSFEPSTAPGCRAPHIWLGGERSVYDGFGPGYTLLRLDREVDVAAFVKACRRRDVPLAVIDVPPEVAPDIYRHALVLCRADQHIAWRDNSVPDDMDALLDRLTGRLVVHHR